MNDILKIFSPHIGYNAAEKIAFYNLDRLIMIDTKKNAIILNSVTFEIVNSYIKQDYKYSWFGGSTYYKNTIIIGDRSSDKIIYSTGNGDILVRNANNGIIINKLKGHTKSCWSIVVHNNHIISGSQDHTIIIWDANSGDMIKKIYNYKDTITTLLIHNEQLIVGGFDGTIKFFDINSFKLVDIISPYNYTKDIIMYNDDIMVLCFYQEITFYNKSNRQNICTWYAAEYPIDCVRLYKNYVLVAVQDKILFLDINKIYLAGDTIFSSFEDRVIKYNAILIYHTMKTNNIKKIYVVENKLLISYYNDMMQIWNIDTLTLIKECKQKIWNLYII